MSEIKVAFVGNPNCGKTTLFNAVTGSKLKVANWPGVTVEKIEGKARFEEFDLSLTDTPGIYSLTSYTIEEKVTRKCVMDDEIDVIVNVLDASSLERNLYLTLQLLELGKPVIIALNMMDIVRDRGLELDLHRLPEMLGDIPIVPVSAAKKEGLDILLHAVVHHYHEEPQEMPYFYSQEIEGLISKIEIMIGAHYPKHAFLRWHAIKLLEWDEDVRTEHPISILNVTDKNFEKEIIRAKYKYIDNIVKEVMFHKEELDQKTEKVDRILTNNILGVPIFLFIMAFVFFLTFQVGDALKVVFEIGIDYVSQVLTSLLSYVGASEMVRSLVVDGIIAGVGGILTFIPNIFILFLALALLEDSGYMSRVAYVMDGIMGKIGLSGKAFLPMILGFGCTVPAIMATRALETQKDRERTMFITPFMSCSARLPIYVLFADIFFGKYATIASFSLYVIGLLCAIAIAFVMHLFDKDKSSQCLLIELPEYKKPNFHTIRIYVFTKIKDYLMKAGTIIFIASVVIWFILNFGLSGMVHNPEDSFGALIGNWMVPILKPAGLGMWQIGVALISGISAKEVVVSSFAVLFGITNANSADGMSVILANIQSQIPGFGPLNAFSLMLFCLLYVPCAATIATIRKESDSIWFTIKQVIFQLLFAYFMSVLVFQVGSLFI